MTLAAAITGSYFLCFAALIGLALFVYRKNPSAWLNRYFALFAVAILSWLVTLFDYDRQSGSGLLGLGRLNFASAAFVVLFGFLFVREITRNRRHENYDKITLALVAETIVLAALTLGTPFIDAGENLSAGQHVTTFGPLFPLFVLHIVLYIAVALWLAFASRRRVSPRVRAQLSVIGLGIAAMAAVVLITNLLLPFSFHIFAFQEVGALSTIALLAALAYAITVHRLFDVRVFVRRALVYTLLLGLTAAAYNGLIFGVAILFQGRFGSYDWHTALPNILIFAVLGFTFEPVRNRLDLSISRLLYRQEQENQELLRSLAQSLNGVLSLDEALELLMTTLVKRLRLRHGVVYVFQPGEGGEPVIKRVKQTGYSRPSVLSISEDSPLIAYFSRRPEVVTVEALEELERGVSTKPKAGRELKPPDNVTLIREVREKMIALHAAIAVPLFLKEQPLGFILLSGNASGDTFGDPWLLETIAVQAVSAIEKARLFESDRMKTEFVSIASHELLTPIAAMQGYLSMILIEHFGKVDSQAREYLDRVYVSANRLAGLVKDLLSVSRLESGKIQLNLRAVNVRESVAGAVQQLQIKAKEKELQLVNSLENQEEALPPVLADPDRLMEILVNLIGNAVKYTPKGSVTVSARSESKPSPCLRISVADTGLGMSREAQTHLFEKFYRVDSPDTVGIPGTGLGLYITKSMVEKMAGTLAVQSAPGHGSTFAFTLPLFKVESAT